MNIQFNDHDMEMIQKAKDSNNWHILETWKQRFIYQRYCCENNKNTVQEIALVAREELRKKDPQQAQLIDTAEKMFAS